MRTSTYPSGSSRDEFEGFCSRSLERKDSKRGFGSLTEISGDRGVGRSFQDALGEESSRRHWNRKQRHKVESRTRKRRRREFRGGLNNMAVVVGIWYWYERQVVVIRKKVVL